MYRKWSTLKKLIWLKYTGAIGGATWKTVTGAIVTFVTNLIKPLRLTAELEPKQDLHGQDAPYPPGGGKNKLDWNKVSVSDLTHYGMQFTKGDQEGTVVISGTLTVDGGAVAPIQYADYSLSGKGYVFLTEKISGDDVIQLNRTYGFRTESEKAIAVYLSGEAGETYTETFRVSIYEPPAPTAWSPYENICPISGWTGANVYSASGNLFDPDANPQKFIDQSGNVVTNGTLSRTTDPIYINSSVTKAWLKSSRAVGALCIASYDKNNNLLLRTASLGVLSLSQNIPDGTAYVRFAKYGVTGDEADLCANFGASAVEGFPEYKQITSIAISWQTEAGTVYGGTLTINEDGSVGLTADRVCKTLTTARNLSGTYVGSIIYNSNSPETSDANFAKPFTCNRLRYDGMWPSSSGWKYGAAINAGGTSFNLWVSQTAFADLSAASAWLQSNGTQICYYLATPVTISLTASQINTLQGNNVVWVDDSDDITVQYLA